MKKFLSLPIILAIVLFQSCSTPEERAKVVEGADSASAVTAPTSAPENPGTSSDTATANSDSTKSNNNDSAKGNNNQKMTDFKHTPIDTNRQQ